MWVEAERRATYETVRLDLRNRILPPVREINALTGDLMARGSFDRVGIRHARRLYRAVEDILQIVRFDDLDETEINSSLTNTPEEESHV